MTGLTKKLVLPLCLLIGLGIALISGHKTHSGSVKLKPLNPLPQDSAIQVYTNQNPANTFTDHYRQQERFGDDLEQVMIDAINQANRSIDVAVQELRLPRIAHALRQKQQQGIQVRVIIENSYRRPHSDFSAAELDDLPDRERNRILEGRRLIDANNDGQLAEDEIHNNDALVILETAQIPLIDDTADGSKGSGLMHHKFIVIDGIRTIVTSANFTMSDTVGDFAAEASRGNPNTLLDIQSRELAAAFLEEFNILWGDGPGGQPDSRFGVKKPHRTAKKITIDKTEVNLQFSPAKTDIAWENTTNGLIASKLQTAKNTIDLALFVFSDQALVDSLEPLHKNGIQMRALIDSGFIYRPYSEALDMLGVTIADKDCKVELNNRPWQKPAQQIGTPQLPTGDLLHHKFGIVDQHVVIVGSQNWTEAANRGNDEVAMTIANKTVAAHYQREFDRLAATAFFGIPESVKQKAKSQNCRIPVVDQARSPSQAASQKINLNTATIAQLDTLPGIGQKTAQRIIEQRQKQPFRSLADLDAVPGIGSKTLKRLESQVTW